MTEWSAPKVLSIHPWFPLTQPVTGVSTQVSFVFR